MGKKEYNYEYEEGKIVRATEAEIELSGDIVTSKAIVNTVKYYYDTDNEKNQKMSIVNYVKLLKKNGATPLFFISVNGKKGWW